MIFTCSRRFNVLIRHSVTVGVLLVSRVQMMQRLTLWAEETQAQIVATSADFKKYNFEASDKCTYAEPPHLSVGLTDRRNNSPCRPSVRPTHLRRCHFGGAY